MADIDYSPVHDLETMHEAIHRLLAHYEPLPFVDISGNLPRHATLKYNHRSLAQIEQIVIHHVGVDAAVTPEQTAEYHIRKGWPGIGYTFYVRTNGDAYQTQPLGVVSYHCAGACNVKGIGICLEGSFMHHEPPEAQLEATRAVVGWLFAQLPQPLAVFGHQELRQTACPGDTWGAWKDKILP